MNVFLSATSGMKDKVKFRSLTTRIDISHNILCLSHRIEIQTFQRKEKKKDKRDWYFSAWGKAAQRRTRQYRGYRDQPCVEG